MVHWIIRAFTTPQAEMTLAQTLTALFVILTVAGVVIPAFFIFWVWVEAADKRDREKKEKT